MADNAYGGGRGTAGLNNVRTRKFIMDYIHS
jgi:hypothetical protein